MTFNPEIHHRRSIRLQDYDYRSAGVYFVTACAYQRECLFGEVIDGEMRLNDVGTIVVACWQDICNHFQHVALDEFAVMPNHLHAILQITGFVGAKQGSSASPDVVADGREKGEAGGPLASPLRDGTVSGSLSAVIQNFKSVSTRKINKLRTNTGCSVWQRNYYEHVVRNDNDLDNIRQYIVNNPLKWDLDENNPANVK